MKALVVYAHPRDDSFVSKVRHEVVSELVSRGVEYRMHDLYADGFNPVLSEWERLQHLADPTIRTSKDPLLERYTDDVLWCDSLILVYPTWWSGLPTMLKGWMDRVLINGVAWTLPLGAKRIQGNLQNVRRLVVVTTHGSSKFVNAFQGESGKRVVFRGLRALCHPKCRTRWIAMYGVDRADNSSFPRFQRRVRRSVGRLV